MGINILRRSISEKFNIINREARIISELESHEGNPNPHLVNILDTFQLMMITSSRKKLIESIIIEMKIELLGFKDIFLK
jgi:hypothetical protein